MMDWSTCTAVEKDSEKVSGSWVFRGTRVPVVALFDNLEGGASVEVFLSGLRSRDTRAPEESPASPHCRDRIRGGWHDLKNGELLARAEAEGFDALVDELAAHQGDVTRVAHAIDNLHADGYEEIAFP